MHQHALTLDNHRGLADEHDVNGHLDRLIQAQGLQVDVRDIAADGVVLNVAEDRQIRLVCALDLQLHGSAGPGSVQSNEQFPGVELHG